MLHRLRVLNSQHEDTPLAEVSLATHRALGASPAAVTLATLDDALLVPERPNVPGTIHQWPNWSLALPQTLEEIEHNPDISAVAAALAETRPPVVH